MIKTFVCIISKCKKIRTDPESEDGFIWCGHWIETHHGNLQAWLCLRLWTTKIKGSIGAQNKRRVESTRWMPKILRGSWLPPKERWGSDGWAIYLSGAASAPPFFNWAFEPHFMKKKSAMMLMHISHQFLCADVLYVSNWNMVKFPNKRLFQKLFTT